MFPSLAECLAKCPLCGKAPNRIDSQVAYACQTPIIPSIKKSHYYVEMRGDDYVPALHIFPYSVVSYSSANTSDIHHLAMTDKNIMISDVIISVPHIHFDDPDKLLVRVKLLLAFS